MKALKKNMKDQILDKTDHKILHCPGCDKEFSGNAGDYWDVPDNFVFGCSGCDCEMELVTKKIKIKYV